MKSTAFRVLFSGLIASAFLCGAAGAQVAGFKISTPAVTILDSQNAEAEFDITVYGETTTDIPPAYRAGTPLNNSSSTVFTQTYSFGNGPRPYQVRIAVDSQWNFPDRPGLEFGDGAILQTIALPLDPGTTGTTGTLTRNKIGVGMPPVFRGSFTHNYGNGSHTVTARLTPRGAFASPSPGVHVAPVLTTGNTFMGTLSNSFVYQVTVSPLSPPGTGTYTFQSTNTSSDSFPSTVISVTNTETVDVMLPAPMLTVDGGTCPGVLNVNITGLTPNARVTFWAANDPGAYPIPTGPCAGTIVDLDTDHFRRAAFADSLGDYSFSRFFFPDQCNIMMQAVNHGNCTKSAVVTPPVATIVKEAGPKGPGTSTRIRP